MIYHKTHINALCRVFLIIAYNLPYSQKESRKRCLYAFTAIFYVISTVRQLILLTLLFFKGY